MTSVSCPAGVVVKKYDPLQFNIKICNNPMRYLHGNDLIDGFLRIRNKLHTHSIAVNDSLVGLVKIRVGLINQRNASPPFWHSCFLSYCPANDLYPTSINVSDL